MRTPKRVTFIRNRPKSNRIKSPIIFALNNSIRKRSSWSMKEPRTLHIGIDVTKSRNKILALLDRIEGNWSLSFLWKWNVNTTRIYIWRASTTDWLNKQTIANIWEKSNERFVMHKLTTDNDMQRATSDWDCVLDANDNLHIGAAIGSVISTWIVRTFNLQRIKQKTILPVHRTASGLPYATLNFANSNCVNSLVGNIPCCRLFY